MCGIAGFVGRVNRKDAVDLLVRLGKETVVRGEDAWGLMFKSGKLVQYTKSPGSFGEVSKKEIFKLLPEKVEVVALHCRAATQGSPQNNENNHPVVASSNMFWVMHNGVVHEFKHSYDDWWRNYNLRLLNFDEGQSDVVDTMLICEKLDEFELNRKYEPTVVWWSEALSYVKKELSGSMALCIFVPEPFGMILWGQPMQIAVYPEQDLIIFGSTQNIVSVLSPQIWGIKVRPPMISLDYSKGLFFDGKKFSEFVVRTVNYWR
ncbi:MAG: class II glutamine amidotransferase [Archaeoglobaceae archaeon]